MENFQQLQSLLSHSKDIVILSHRNPDGDAMGSSLGLASYLEAIGHHVRVIMPSEYPDFLAWMPGADHIIICDLDKDLAFESIIQADLVFCLDFNALDRIDPMERVVMKSQATKVMIDHHLYPEGFPDFTLSDTSASSTCELVHDFMQMMGHGGQLSPQVADCLYTGLVTDTGSFKYNTRPKTLQVAARLLEAGADSDRIQEEVFNSMKEKELRLLGHCLSNRMEIHDDLGVGIVWLSKEDFEEFDIKRGETEGIVNQILRMKKVRIAAFIKEQQTIIKLSFRSKGDFSVQEVARRYFNGGGHKNASGGHFHGSVEACKERFLEAVRKHLAQA